MLTQIFINIETSQVLAQAITSDVVRPGWYSEERDRLADQRGIPAESIIVESMPGHTPFANPLAEMVDGEWKIAEAPASPTLYVHVTLNGGMQSPAGTLYLKNDGVDALTVQAELRDGPDPATSNAVTQLDGQDISAMWALELVNVDTGALADTPLVQWQQTRTLATRKLTTQLSSCR